MKKLFTLAFALMLSTSVVVAQSNRADVSQQTSNSEVIIQQTFTSEATDAAAMNIASVEQSGVGNHDAEIIQQNRGHWASRPYVGGTRLNSVNLNQAGENHSAYIRQAHGRGNYVWLSQEAGEDNRAHIVQNVGEQVRGYYGETARQQGSRNQLFVFQSFADGTDEPNTNESWNTAYVDQLGSDNYLRIVQPNASSRVRALQEGDDNYARVEQRSNNSAHLRQLGDSHYADVLQSSQNNTATLTQDGVAHRADLVQMGGEFNVAMISQTGGSAFVADVTQNGANNTASITQSK